jgi:hypothetical protein
MTEHVGSEPGARPGTSPRPSDPKGAEDDRKKNKRKVRDRLIVTAKTARKWLLPFVLAGVIALIVIASLPDLRNAFSGSLAEKNCPSASLSPRKSPGNSVVASAGSVAAKLRTGQREEVDFGRSMTSRSIVLYLDLSKAVPGSSRFHVLVNSFTRSDDASLQDPARNIAASAISDKKTLLLSVCFKRSGNPRTSLGDPGSYAGSVTIDDSRLVAPVTVPITVTMQYPNGVFLLWLYAGAIIPGTWCLWVIRDKPGGTESALNRRFFKWLITINGVVSIVAGSVAAFTVYVAVYLRNPTWAANALEVLTLYGGMFSAFVTTAGIASLTGGKTASPKSGDEEMA